jgi:hypothetical protein
MKVGNKVLTELGTGVIVETEPGQLLVRLDGTDALCGLNEVIIFWEN